MKPPVPLPNLDVRLDLIPEEPGVYLMKDEAGQVIYVGKAINLPRRLRSYFTENPQGNAKVLAMISHIRDFDYVLCANELEALILENNLIKHYEPHYNILLRDDKEYPYIRVTLNEAYPRVLKSFHILDDYKEGVRYFGPYQSGDLYRALQAIYEIFPLKRCRRVLPRDIGKGRPCLNYYIGKCVGPCLGSVPREEYRAVIEELVEFLEGKSVPFSRKLEADMRAASDRMDFEQAARLRDRLQALEKLNERQTIALPELQGEADVLALAENDSEKAVRILKIREGRIISTGSYFFPDRGESRADLYQAFILQYYSQGHQLPQLILVSDLPDSLDQVEAWLYSQAGRKVRIHRPQRGLKLRWLEMAERNAEESLIRHVLLGGGQGKLESTLEDLADRLSLEEYPHRIEAYDIANLGEDDKAASMIVFVDGKPKRSAYRIFNIKRVEGQDDYASMREVISRRLARLADEDFGQKPQLILLDGGPGHVAAIAPLIQAQAPDIALAGMVKDDRHRSRGLIRQDLTAITLRPAPDQEARMTAEARNKDLSLLRLITAIQNEAHRFAGRQQKKLSKKRNLRWSLEEIPGVGPARRKVLLQTFKSLKGIAQASLEDLEKKAKLPSAVALAVFQHFHPEALADPAPAPPELGIKRTPRIFALADLHLAQSVNKPMDKFGPAWRDHTQRLQKHWQEEVGDQDYVLIPGDISWAMHLQEAEADLQLLHNLPGQKVLLRGNHDYWWQGLNKIRKFAQDQGWSSLHFLQNDALPLGDRYMVAGSRLWLWSDDQRFGPADAKILQREEARLRLSLQAAHRALDGRQLLVMTHFPPFAKNLVPNPITGLIREAGALACVFGHIHHADSPYCFRQREIDGVLYSLVAGDYLGFKPQEILPSTSPESP
ncbi:MAG: excinuclease ABC subunit UvrC [Clostridiales bacterium]|nr:excinuclease ABC subunit UvrC [Clostridiales bacterium]